MLSGLHTLFYKAKLTKTRFQCVFKVLGVISSVRLVMLNVGETLNRRSILGKYCASWQDYHIMLLIQFVDSTFDHNFYLEHC